jgi:hypothetical protein
MTCTDNQSILLSPIYSIFDKETSAVTAPGGVAPIIACLVAFACCELPGFNVPEPSPQIAQPLGGGDNGGDGDDGDDKDEDYKDDEYESDIHSIGSYFDEFGIGQRALNDPVCDKLHLVFFLTIIIMTFRQALLTTPRRYQIFPARLFE